MTTISHTAFDETNGPNPIDSLLLLFLLEPLSSRAHIAEERKSRAMFDAVFQIWDWIVTGICDPERSNDLVAHTESEADTAFFFGNGHGNQKVDLNTMEEIWKEVVQSRQLNLQKFALEQWMLEFLIGKIEEHQQTSNTTRKGFLLEINLCWCTFELHDGTAETLQELVELNAPSIQSIRFWKTRQEDQQPNDILQRWFSTAHKLVHLTSWEVSYFDLRQRHLSQALCNMISQRNRHSALAHLDLSFCKFNPDVWTRLSEAVHNYDKLESLFLSGTGLDDNTLKIIVHGLDKSYSRIHSLNLSHNSALTPAALSTLAVLLKQQVKLQALFLNHNDALCRTSNWGAQTENERHFQAFAKALTEDAPHLHTLHLAGCGLSNATQTAEVLFRPLLDSSRRRSDLHTLDLSQNLKLVMDSKWFLPLCLLPSLQHLVLPSHMRQDNQQYTVLSQCLTHFSCNLIDIKFVWNTFSILGISPLNSKKRPRTPSTNDTEQDDDTALKLCPNMQALMRRNQLMYLACHFNHPVQLWPRIIQRLQDQNAPGSVTSVYCFIQTLFGAGQT